MLRIRPLDVPHLSGGLGGAVRRRAIWTHGTLTTVFLVALTSDWLIVRGNTTAGLALCLAPPVAFGMTRGGLPAVAAVLLLLSLNGIPGANLASFNIHGSFEALDVVASGLIALAASRYIFGQRLQRDRFGWLLMGWSAVFAALWLTALVKATDRGVPVLQAALYGRDFLFFALFVPVSSALVKNERELSRFLALTAALTLVYALGEIAVSAGALSGSLINATKTLRVGPITRVYSPMNDLVALGFACSLGYALLKTGVWARYAAFMATICGIAVVLQLTRAIWFGLIAGMAVALAIWCVRRSPWRVLVRRRMRHVTVGIVALLASGIIIAPQALSNTATETVASRVSEGVADVGASARTAGNTVAYRQSVSSSMLQVLGPHWLLGLGFLHPATIRFPQLPRGSTRNNDLGLFNGLMTMGVLGTVLVYVPVLLGLWWSIPDKAVRHEWGWLQFGAMLWLISVIAASLTLVTLFSSGGLILTAVLLGVLSRIAQLPGKSTRTAASRLGGLTEQS
jgi:hypothetical protein